MAWLGPKEKVLQQACSPLSRLGTPVGEIDDPML